MALEFDAQLSVPAIPTDPRRAARAAIQIAKKIDEAGGLEPAIEAALDAIYAVAPGDKPSELKRLRLIYRDFYTRDELRDLVRRNLREYGFLRVED